MKTLRILLIAAFLFSIAVTSVGAAPAPERAVGFIRLLDKVNPDVPVEVQSSDALHRIMPQVLAAQKSGQIAYFEPSLRTGVLKVIFNSNTRAASFAGRTVNTTMKASAVAAPMRRRDVAAPSPALSPNIYVYGYDNCYYGFSLGTNSRVVATLLSGTTVLSVSEDVADASGYLSDCFTWAGFYNNVLPGYKVRFKIYDGVSDALLGTFQATAPAATFSSINKPGAIVNGTGPVSTPYEADLSHANLNAGNTYSEPFVTGTTSGTGAWSANFTGAFRGGDWLSLYVFSTANIIFNYDMAVPYIYCQLGNNFCEISGFANKPASLKLTRGATSYNSTGTFSDFGWFSVDIENASGVPILTKAGDKVSGTNVASYTLPNLTTAINYTSDVVNGKAPANKYFYLYVLQLNPSTWYSFWAHSNASSNYAHDFTTDVDLVTNKAYSAEVYYIDPVTGNRTDYYKTYSP